MRRTITTILAGALVLGAFAAPMADAKKKKPKKYTRTAEATYANPSPGAAVAAGGNSAAFGYCAGFPECIEFPTTAKDKYIKVKVADTSGQKVVGYIDQGDTDGDGIGDLVHKFCGEHSMAVPITSGVPVGVNIYPGTCDDGSTAAVTTGTIKVTFSNKPF